MPIRPFLSGRAFDPETIDVMSEALKGVCETLSLKIVELTQRGVRDVALLRTMTLSEFKYE
jgi:hypothetical protein